jgi:hypothetical protein
LWRGGPTAAGLAAALSATSSNRKSNRPIRGLLAQPGINATGRRVYPIIRAVM